MKEKLKSNRLVLAIIIITVGVCVFFCTQKSGMFIDEIYSYGLSNGYYSPFIRDVLGGEISEEILTKEQMFDYIIANEDEVFRLDSVYYNQTRDVHPPLYYILVHIVSSFIQGRFSMWPMLVLNIIIYTATLVVLYLLAVRLQKNKTTAAVTVLLYALSQGGLSTVLMIRMYILLTLFTVLLSYFVVRLLEEPKWYWCICVCATIFAGMFTQYYYVFYAFFVCCAYIVYTLRKKRIRDMLTFAASGVIGIALFVLAYPAVFAHLFRDGLVSGENAVSNLSNIGNYVQRIIGYGGIIKDALLVSIILGVIAVITALARWGFSSQIVRDDSDRYGRVCVIIVPTFVTFVVVAVISPIYADRYLYNILPVFALAAGTAVGLILPPIQSRFRRIGAVLVPVLCVLMLLNLASDNPDYLYPEHQTYNQLISEYVDSPCIYIDKGYNAPLTQDLMQMMVFDEVYIASDASSEGMQDYLSNHENAETAIVYVDVSTFWSSGFDPEVVMSEMLENTDYTQYTLLYEYGLSETYVLS